MATGGNLILSRGQFHTDGSIAIADQNSITLQGQGRSKSSDTDTAANYVGTSITLADGANCDMLTITHTTTCCYAIRVLDMTLHGNKANQVSGKGISMNCRFSEFRNVTVEWVKEHGIYLVSTNHATVDSGANTFKDIFVREASYGFYHAADVYDNILQRVYVSGADSDGIYIGGGGNDQLYWCEVDNCDQYGMNITSANKIQISNCKYSGNITTAQLFVYGSNRVTVGDCLFYPYVGGANTSCILLGLYAATMTNVDIHDNICYEGKYGVNISAYTTPTVSNVVLHHNHFKSQTSAAVNATVTAIPGIKLRDNEGYISKGERRSYANTLTAAAKDAVAFYWNNPEKQDVLIKEVMTDITTASTDTTAAMSIGIADSSTGTNAGTEFSEGVPTDATGIHVLDAAILCEDSTSATDAYVVGIYTVEDSTKLVGSYHITYVGR